MSDGNFLANWQSFLQFARKAALWHSSAIIFRTSLSMLIKRQLAPYLLSLAQSYSVLAITGPRQSGKTTLAKYLFPHKSYISLEELDHRQFAEEDPRAFLGQFPQGAILDEVQRCPHLFSYLQGIVDTAKQPGMFILTGSQQFGLIEKITQSLAGRVGLLELLPFSFQELQAANCAPATLEELLFCGLYPPIYDKHAPPQKWYLDYTTTYLERDVRQLINVQDLRLFHRFIQMCAMRTGQLLNLSSLATDCGISHNTARAWIGLLEASYIIFLLTPHYANFNKRLIKSPKLYFYDTGLVCALAGISESTLLTRHPMRGALFETWVINEIVKARFNKGLSANIFFWRDSQGHEVDVLIEKGQQLIPVEIKSGQTISSNYFKDLQYWQNLSHSTETSWLVYAGDQQQKRTRVSVIGWKEISQLVDDKEL